ncbi:MAG: endolytic transglycosylase MltG [Gammaproteobacteria bacterium]
MTDKEPRKPIIPRPRLTLALLLFLLFCIIAAWCGYTWWRLNSQPLPAASAGMVFTVTKGENLARLASDLSARGVLEHAWDLELLARLRGKSAHIQAGEYRIAPSVSVNGLLGMMVRGDVLLHNFTIVPGTTFQQIFSALESNPIFKHDLQGLPEGAVMTRLGHSGEQAEGRFFPDTYAFPRGTSDVAVLARAYAAMDKHLAAAWAGRAQDVTLTTPYQALIVASIVEKETAVPEEREKIAGVFERRLQRGMHLDADPTVIYGLGDAYTGKLTRRGLASDTPYNTYLHRGLPPTPICMPGLATIEAALHPAAGTALYFVAKGDGTHVFSDTLAEQQRMIRKYQLHRGNSTHDGAGPIHHP